MKQIYFSLLFTFLLITGLTGQIVISEIQYNPPESGTDSLEYLEVTNASSNNVDMDGYSFLEGVVFTFSNILAPGESILISEDSVAMLNVLGVNARQWTDGALGNGGETITLVDQAMNVIDEVSYEDGGAWPSSANGTDGNGSAIELCDLNSDNNDGSNWRASTNETGAEINGKMLKGTPGEANICEEITFPFRTIGEITEIDQEGTGDSVGVSCTIEGVVHGINIISFGIQFTVIDDANDGIAIRSSPDTLGYSVKEGDRLRITGIVDQFRGLMQFSAGSIEVISQNNPLASPIVISFGQELGENTESQLTFLQFVEYVDVSQWLGDSTSFNVDVTNGQEVYTLRIDDNTELSRMPAPFPDEPFNVTGIGGQFGESAPPWLDGYQLYPFKVSDFDIAFSTENETGEALFSVFPNPADRLIHIDCDARIQAISLYDFSGQMIQICDPNSISINVSNLASGLYLLNVRTDKGSDVAKVIID